MAFLKNKIAGAVPTLKPNSLTYNFVVVSGNNLEISQTCLHYKPVSNNFCSGGRGGEKKNR
jgi:hypothetical protein